MQGNVGRNVGKCVRVEDCGVWWEMWREVNEKCGGSEKM